MRIDERVLVSSFYTGSGADEFFVTVTSAPRTDFRAALAEISDSYDKSLSECGLSHETQIFSRIFLSDMENHNQDLDKSQLSGTLQQSAFSCIEQPPLNSGPVALFSYHVKPKGGALTKRTLSIGLDTRQNSVLIEGAAYSQLWCAHYCGSEGLNTAQQTRRVFTDLCGTVEDAGMQLLSNGIRTWVYVRDIDNNYKDMVKARGEFFVQHDLTPRTRYLASTGIEGISREAAAMVYVDALAVGGIEKEQVVRMQAPTHMCRTIEYGVTFERGLRVRFGDRSHLYVSGTASINNKGEALHLGNVRKQTERTIRNVEALLAGQGGRLSDMAYLLVYLRDPDGTDTVLDIVQDAFPGDIPIITVHGAVCRPDWLVELEGVGIIPDSSEYPSFL